MLPLVRARVASRIGLISSMLLFAGATELGQTQEVSVTRLPNSTDLAVRLENMSSHVVYQRSGDSYFIIPAGRYSIQLLRGTQIAYQEVEYIGPDAPSTRTVNPNSMDIVVGLPEPSPQFQPNVCSALETAAQLAVSRYGLRSNNQVQRRLANADMGSNGSCTTSDSVEAFASTLAGSYGVTRLGMVKLSIDSAQLAPQKRPHNHGNSIIYTDPATQRLATQQQPNSNLTPALVGDIKNGISDVAVDDTGKSLLVCGAIDANTPVFCDSNGLAVATPAIARLRTLYKFSVRTAPVDSHGVEDDHWTTFVGEDEYQATEQKLRDSVQTMQANLEQRLTQLEAKALSVPSNQDPGQNARYYATSDLIALAQATQSEIDAALRDVTLQPLRHHFPLHIADPVPAAEFTPSPAAQTIIGKLKDTVAVLSQISGNLGVDLILKTAPVETEGTRLTFQDCDRCNPIVSQGGEHRFYRGRYYIKASLDGYATYEGWLDLVDDPRTTLECEMVRTGHSRNGHPSTCSLVSQ